MAKTPRKPGPSRTNVAFQLTRAQSLALDRFVLDLREASDSATWSKSSVVRAFVDAIDEAGVSIAGVETEDDLREGLVRLLRGKRLNPRR